MSNLALPNFHEIEAEESKFSQDLREIQKTVQTYGNHQYQVPEHIQEIQTKLETMSRRQKEILENLQDIQRRMAVIESLPRSSERRRGGWLPPSYGTEPLLHQKGKAVEVKRELTENEKLRALLKGESVPFKR